MQLQPATTWHAPYLALHCHHVMCTPSYISAKISCKSAMLSNVMFGMYPLQGCNSETQVWQGVARGASHRMS